MAAAAPKRRGRPPKHTVPTATAGSASPFVVSWLTNGDVHTMNASSAAQAKQLVQQALEQGAGPSEVAVYEKVPVAIKVSVSI